MTYFARRIRIGLFLFVTTFTPTVAGVLLAEDRPFRAWDPPAPQGVECRLLHWTPEVAIVETTTRQYVPIDWRNFSREDREYFDGVRGEKQYSAVDPGLLQDAIPLFLPSGNYVAPSYPIAFNGRYLLAASPRTNDPFGDVYSYRDFAPQTQGALLERFADKLSVGETIFAGGPFRESIWLVEEKRSIKEIAPDFDLPAMPYPEDSFVVATDGAIVIYETRLQGTPKDPEKYPCYFFSPWAETGPASQEPLLRFIHIGFATYAKQSPAASSRIVKAAHAKANRGKVGPLADSRIWKQAMLSAESGAQKGQLIQRNSRQALILREDGCLDIVDYPTAADAKYLSELDGFWSPRHDASRPAKYEERKAPVFERDLAAAFRDYDGDKALIDELEAGLVPTPQTPVEDHCWFRESRLSRLADVVLQCDLEFGDREYARLKEAFEERKIGQAEAGKRLVELQGRRIDPTNGDTPAERLLADWRKAYPQSPHPSVISGIAAYRYGWRLRGDGFVGQLDEKEIEGWGLFLDKAEGELDEAENRDDGDAVVAMWRLQIGRCLGYSRGRMDEILERGLKADANFPALHVAMALYLLPMWSGEPGDIAKYMNAATRRFRGQRAINNFVQVYEQLLTTNVEMLKDGTFDKETISMVAADMVELGVPGSQVAQYAEMIVYFAGDAPLAKKLIEKSGGIEKLAVATAAGNPLFQDGADHDKARAFFRDAMRRSGASSISRTGDADSVAEVTLGAAFDPRCSMKAALLDGGSKALTLVGPDRAVVVDLERKTVLGEFALRDVALKQVHASNDGKTVVVSGTTTDGTYVVASVDVRRGVEITRMKNVEHREPISPELLSPDGRWFVKSVRPDRAVDPKATTKFQLWDVATGEKIAEEGWKNGMDDLLFTPDSGTLTIWHNAIGAYDIAARTFGTLEKAGAPYPIGRPVFAPTGEMVYFAMAPSTEGHDPKRMFEMEAKRSQIAVVKSLDDLDDPRVAPFSYGWRSLQAEGHYLLSNGARRLFAVGGIFPPGQDVSVIDVYDTATGERTHRLFGHVGQIKDLHYRPESETLVTVSSDMTLRIWDVSEKGLAAAKEKRGDVSVKVAPGVQP